MSGPISRIGGNGAVRRDTPSSGHEQIAKRENQQAQQMRRPGVSDEVRDKVKGVASMYEKQFLGEMMKAMRSTVSPTNEPSMAENIYKDQLDSQYVDSWGDNGGIGLSNLIYEQIMEKYFGESPTQALKQQGPVALTDRDVIRVSKVGGPTQGPSNGTLVAANGSTQIPLKVEVRPSTNSGPAKVQAPWDANVVQTSKVDGKTAVTLEHGEGVRSTLIFDGVPSSEVKPGQKLAKGQSLGVLNPDAKSFFWNLNHSKTSSQYPSLSPAAPSTQAAQPLVQAAPQPAMEPIPETEQANRTPAETGVTESPSRMSGAAEPASLDRGQNVGTETAP